MRGLYGTHKIEESTTRRNVAEINIGITARNTTMHWRSCVQHNLHLDLLLQASMKREQSSPANDSHEGTCGAGGRQVGNDARVDRKLKTGSG